MTQKPSTGPPCGRHPAVMLPSTGHGGVCSTADPRRPRGPPHTTRRTSAHVGACVADRSNRGAIRLRVVARQPFASNSQRRPVRCSTGLVVYTIRCSQGRDCNAGHFFSTRHSVQPGAGLQRGPFFFYASFVLSAVQHSRAHCRWSGGPGAPQSRRRSTSCS